MFKKLISVLLEILFPTQCVLCKQAGSLLCHTCARALPIVPVRKLDPSSHLSSVTICANYHDERLQRLIAAYKFTGMRDLSGPLGAMLEKGYARHVLPQKAIIIPIPLHHRRQRKRGFNQSYLLARFLSGHTGHALDTHLTRIRARRPQHTLNRAERLTNMLGVFRYTGGAAPDTVLLIDDIATTFATLDAAAQELKKHGTKAVHALVIAKNDP